MTWTIHIEGESALDKETEVILADRTAEFVRSLAEGGYRPLTSSFMGESLSVFNPGLTEDVR